MHKIRKKQKKKFKFIVLISILLVTVLIIPAYAYMQQQLGIEGKTLILDKLMIDASFRVNGCEYVPAIINFKDIHKNIETCINYYWQHDYKKVCRVLDTEKILLLIDNIDFSDTTRLNILNQFLLIIVY